MSAVPEVYDAPLHGWTCFHCGETFHTPGSARTHFGPTPASVPGCVIKAGEERGLLKAIRAAEAATDDAVRQRELAEMDARAVHAEAAEMLGLVSGATNAHDVRCHLDSLQGQLIASQQEAEALRRLINAPELAGFLRGVHIEAVHQVERWGTAHDRAKRPADWFWLVGYLAGKALHASIASDADKSRHHCISTAAALYNWHCAISGNDVRMCPGRSDIAAAVDAQFPGSAS